MLVTSAGLEMSSSSQTTGQRPAVADWRGGMSACCTLIEARPRPTA